MPLPTIPSGNVNSGLATGYDVANSVRYNDGDSPKLNINFGSDGTLNKWTFSMWFKRSTLGTAQRLFCVIDSGMDDYIKFGTDDQLEWVFDNEDGSNKGVLKTNRKFRDVSAWYHLVCRLDTTDSTAGDRMRMYINGTEETSFATDTNPTLNETGDIGRDNNHYIGTSGSSQYFDGYIAEVCMINNQSLAPTSFGEFDEDSPRIWKPIDVSGLTAGTNGFYLDFEDSSNLGNDANGGTDWTETNLAATDQATDTCTNNFATMNPLFARSDNVTFTEGNLKGALASEGNQIIASTIAVSAGKWYFEFQANAQEASAYMEVGIFPTYHTTVTPNYIGGLADGYSLQKNGYFYNNNSAVATDGPTYGTSDIMGVALDLDSGTKTIKYYKNGSLEDTYNITVTEDVYIGWRAFGSGEALSMNFGSPKDSISSGNADGNGYGNFEYAVPSGYFSLCTKNLAEYGG